MKRLLLLTAALTVTALAGCDGGAVCDTPGCGPDPNVPAGIFVVNQGNFSSGNGTVARYDPETGRVDSTAALGSILQSATLEGGRLYVTANTGNRVDVFDAVTFQRTAQIAVESPRYVALVSATKAYVTSFVFNVPDSVVVVNPQTGARLGAIPVGGDAEGLAVSGTRAYVATGAFSASQNVVVIDTATDAVVDTIDVGCAPRLALADTDGDVFVVCTGAAAGEDVVVVLDGATGAEEARIPAGSVGTFGFGQDASLSTTARELYLARTDRTVLRIDTRTRQAAGVLGPLGEDPLGAVTYDAPSGRLYVAHAPRGQEFVGGGYVTVHDRGGTEVGRFSSGGVAPSHLVVRPRD